MKVRVICPHLTLFEMKRVISFLNKVEESLLAFLIISVALFVFVQVILRYVFKIAFPWAEELSRYIAILLTFMGASLGIKHSTHFNMEAVQKLLPESIRALCQVFVSLVGSIFFALIVYLTILNIQKLARFSSLTPTLRIPMYLPYVPMAFFCLVASFRYLLESIKTARALFLNKSWPG